MLTLELPPSAAALEARTAEQTRQMQERAARTNVVPRRARGGYARGRGALPSRGRGGAERVVGRLGQLTEETRIYGSRSSRARLLTTAPSGTYIAIQENAGSWYGVLMADGSTGWLESDRVKMLEFQVVSTGTDSRAPLIQNAAAPGSVQQAILDEAYKYLGVRYVWGGNGFGGIDCSGFVKNVFATCGFSLPRTATQQMAYGMDVPSDQLQAGDRLYFGTKADGVGVTHTGIYIGNGYFIHSSSSRKGVTISHMTERTYARIYRGARR